MPKPRVLFVDDDPLLLGGLRRALKSRAETWDMTFLDSPHAALTAHRTAPFDAVISDVCMPGMDGLDLVRAMQSGAPEAIYILLTGTADLQTAVSAINTAKIFRFFMKPTAAHLVAEGIESGLAERTRKSQGVTMVRNAPATAFLSQAALNRVPVGVVAVDGKARVLFANRAGGELLSRKDGLIIGPDGVCRAGIPVETAQLHAAIAAAIQGNANGDSAHAIGLSRSDEARPLTAMIVRLELDSNNDAIAAIFVADHDILKLPSPDAIAQLFGLTPSEARLAHALALGPDLETAAAKCGVTTSSARTYLKQVFAKLGVERQADLLRLIFTTPTPL